MDLGMKVICERILAKIKEFLHEKNIELEMNTEELLDLGLPQVNKRLKIFLNTKLEGLDVIVGNLTEIIVPKEDEEDTENEHVTIGWVGVNEIFRGLKFGKILVILGIIFAFIESGFREFNLDDDSEKPRFYSSLGFQPREDESSQDDNFRMLILSLGQLEEYERIIDEIIEKNKAIMPDELKPENLVNPEGENLQRTITEQNEYLSQGSQEIDAKLNRYLSNRFQPLKRTRTIDPRMKPKSPRYISISPLKPSSSIRIHSIPVSTAGKTLKKNKKKTRKTKKKSMKKRKYNKKRK